MAAGPKAWVGFKAFALAFSHYSFVVLPWIPIVVFVNDHVFELTTIRGPSMSPYFNERYNETTSSDVCLTRKFWPQQDLQRGMIVTFYNPLKPDVLTTKRIVGLPDDLIRTKPPFPDPYVRVPPNHVWVEGDEGGSLTKDSNTYGPISIRLIQGRVSHIVWPLRKAGTVKWWEHPDRLAAFRNA
ncbi:mitochondrial inner membrane protease subunit-like protein [Coniella lustricola]|uniref:Mitochondrial inner membrane protease subunit 2 n=1 Tax=Coniella lustricola TaxID=2025994 RepID=A0A2T3A316_9PEZI|nr:mitochondrial inner membrane protease subunit-like protein [Coniella lustricola]